MILQALLFVLASISAFGEPMEEYAALHPSETEIRRRLPERRHDFEAAVRARVYPKIAGDISVILNQRWADGVNESDLFHVHLVVRHDQAVFSDLAGVIDASNLIFLYHAHEYDDKRLHESRNIASTLEAAPRPVPAPISYSSAGKAFRTLDNEHFHGWYIGTIYFAMSDEDMAVNRTLELRAEEQLGGLFFGLKPTF